MKKRLLGIASIVVLLSLSVFSCKYDICSASESTVLALDKAIKEAGDLKKATKISTDGNDVFTTDKWVTQADADKLKVAIDAANAVKENPDATNEDVQKATDNLSKAIQTFKAAQKDGKVDKGELNTLIGTAETLKNDTKVSTIGDGSDVYTSEKWVTEADANKLTDAITKAKAVNVNTATASEVKAAIEALTKAKEDFETAKKPGLKVDRRALEEAIKKAKEIDKNYGVWVSYDNGANRYKGEKWVTADVLNKVKDAIAPAETVLNNTSANQAAVDAETKKLTDVLKEFEDSKKDGTKERLFGINFNIEPKIGFDGIKFLDSHLEATYPKGETEAPTTIPDGTKVQFKYVGRKVDNIVVKSESVQFPPADETLRPDGAGVYTLLVNSDKRVKITLVPLYKITVRRGSEDFIEFIDRTASNNDYYKDNEYYKDADVKFKVNAQGKRFNVKVNGKEISAGSDGVYTIKKLDSEKTVEVNFENEARVWKEIKPNRNAKYFDFEFLGDYVEYKSVPIGTEIKFKVTAKDPSKWTVVSVKHNKGTLTSPANDGVYSFTLEETDKIIVFVKEK